MAFKIKLKSEMRASLHPVGRLYVCPVFAV